MYWKLISLVSLTYYQLIMYYPIVHYSNQPLTTGLQTIIGYRQGRSESYFDYKLDKYFRRFIHRNQTVLDSSRNYPYQPDYAIIIPEDDGIVSGTKRAAIHIDIEIDEPYTFSNGGFIACHAIGMDDNRNDYFLSKGWDIIRFTEKQVALYPNACCKFISEHLYHRTGLQVWKENFTLTEDIPEIEMWDRNASLNMYQAQIREHYRSSLKVISNPDAPINIMADGIYLNEEIRSSKQFYRGIYPERDFSAPASLSAYVQELSLYFPHLNADIKGKKTDVNMFIFISTFHGFESFDLSRDYFEFGNYNINVYFIRTDKIICFEIDEYIEDNMKNNLIFIGDDPAYNLFLDKWYQKNNA